MGSALNGIKAYEHYLSGGVGALEVRYNKGRPYIHAFSLRECGAGQGRVAFLNVHPLAVPVIGLVPGHSVYCVAVKTPDKRNDLQFDGNVIALFNESTGRGYSHGGVGDLLKWDDVVKDTGRLINSVCCSPAS